MKRLRSHIAQLLVALLICTGISLSWVQPAHADRQSHAFAQWLSMMANPSEASSDLQKELQELRASGGQLNDMLQKASEIVSKNNEDFDFPFSKDEASKAMYQLLLVEWNQYQTGNAMANVPVQQNIKPLLLRQVDKVDGSGFAPSEFSPSKALLFRGLTGQNTQNSLSFAVEPMSGGIAIGAP